MSKEKLDLSLATHLGQTTELSEHLMMLNQKKITQKHNIIWEGREMRMILLLIGLRGQQIVRAPAFKIIVYRGCKFSK